MNPGTVVVAISGSSGKTTTKDICATLMSQTAPCVSTKGTENYRISVAETLLRLRRNHKFCVIEISEDKPNALDLPIRMARPDIAVITNVGRDHYSHFKSLSAIAHETSKLVHRLPANGTAVLNMDDPLVREIGEASARHCIWVGRDENATIRLLEAKSIWPEPLRLTIEYEEIAYEIRTQLHGEYLSSSVLSSIGVAVALNIPIKEAIKAIEAAKPTEGRMEIVRDTEGVVFIRDDWKAPHWTIHAPFKFIAEAKSDRKIAVIGNVSDSSRSPARRYKSIAREARQCVDLAVFVGDNATKALAARTSPDDESIQAFTDLKQASVYLDDILKAGDLVLLKGSSKEDHLVRLIHDRNKPISCWRKSCGRIDFCDYCNLLYKNGKKGAGKEEHPDFRWRPASGGTTLVVGLGNPGRKYLHTPHNLGFAMIDELASSIKGTWEQAEYGSVCTAQHGSNPLVLLKPAVAINHTGAAIQSFLSERSGEIGNIIIVHDDVDIPWGRLKLKTAGGSGGHKGVRSVIEKLGTDKIDRIRIGVRIDGDNRRGIEMVLDKFTSSQRKQLPDILCDGVKKTLQRCTELQIK